MPGAGRRLAAHGVPHARSALADLHGHVFPEGAALRHAGVSRSARRRRRATTASRARRSASAARGSSTRSARSRPAAPTTSPTLSRAPLEHGARAARSRATTREHGGFGGGPKFPHPTTLELLLAHWQRAAGTGAGDDARARDGHAHARPHGAAAASTTSSAAASSLQRRPAPGRSRTSRRCSTTTRSCSPSTPTRSRRRARRATRAWRAPRPTG